MESLKKQDQVEEEEAEEEEAAELDGASPARETSRLPPETGRRRNPDRKKTARVVVHARDSESDSDFE